ncbi:hypothetical protein PHYSODRAFT_329198 [Phytophthora sojae]|uniref:Uncharacterized protein n=1 Tax=Phytophthora sojae (strain P6497) TaxID=1094619 RepID=G4ZA45_PHYSP|nr:hypothetical protein PHYSODRAFT_329198 [Phytophthora sojae]EGZ21184.1 hypothetical protein PHYSODRAFT_329198 [Phytophthora sojae]|eukprot:XP_009523901.1 hypothetical protein PHYSODRAFT_329198 [Phytophthora sojae]
MSSVHPTVKDAVANFQPPAGFVALPPRRSETSLIFSYGVRIAEAPAPPATFVDAGVPAVWMCLASEACRSRADVFYPLLTGKRSKATKHLCEAHAIVSDKTACELEKKRGRDEELDRLRHSQMFSDDPARVYVLLITLRIINNNLPYRLAEYEESISTRELVMKDGMHAAVNAKVVVHATIELYASSKSTICCEIHDNRVGHAATFTVVPDFWTPKGKGAKFLGLRLYFINKQYEFKSILHGTRHFNPKYSERSGGIRPPCRRWLNDILIDFGLTRADLFGATSDAGPDVKWVMTKGLQLNWEWCIPHMSSAATKKACDCLMSMGDKAPQQLLEYRPHRFLGLTRVVRRILILWAPLVGWYEERLAAQSESATQVEVPLTLLNLRRSTLNCDKVLRDYRSTKERKMYIRLDQLTELARETRLKLQEEFQRVFFSRYTDRAKIVQCSFLFEMQLLLHTNFKNLDSILKDVVLLCTPKGRHTREQETNTPAFPNVVFSEDLMELIDDSAVWQQVDREEQQTVHDSSVEQELRLWMATPTSLRLAANGKADTAYIPANMLLPVTVEENTEADDALEEYFSSDSEDDDEKNIV